MHLLPRQPILSTLFPLIYGAVTEFLVPGKYLNIILEGIEIKVNGRSVKTTIPMLGFSVFVRDVVGGRRL